MATPRIRRVNELVRTVLAERLVDLKDPRIGFVTVTDVRTSNDLERSEVFFTVLPDDDGTVTRTLAGLASAKPLLRREVGAALRTRVTPDLHFALDPVPAQGRRIDELLEREATQPDADR
ncbi:ribosome-binding factor A [soil metagenome]|jgi:ribosome-binding factor A